jgi:RimJ/RimL family protein N-acetyltransferase
LPQSIVRVAEPEELGVLPKSLHEWTSGFIEPPGTKSVLSSSAFDPAGCFVAEDKGSIVGCVAVTHLPRKNWLVIRYLAAKRALSRVYAVEKLLSRALQYVETKKPEFLRATTPSMQPYVDVYRSFAFKPIRRDFRITWDLTGNIESPNKQIEIREVTEKTAPEVAKVLVESIRPYWDWRTEEQGGEEAVAQKFQEGFKKGERWLSGSVGKEVVGLAGLIPDYYKAGDARFRGTFVVPEYRGRGYGRTIMSQASSWAKKLGQHKMTVYTFSYLECLAPGALLYIKSGGKIESEYLQLQRA